MLSLFYCFLHKYVNLKRSKYRVLQQFGFTSLRSTQYFVNRHRLGSGFSLREAEGHSPHHQREPESDGAVNQRNQDHRCPQRGRCREGRRLERLFSAGWIQYKPAQPDDRVGHV